MRARPGHVSGLEASSVPFGRVRCALELLQAVRDAAESTAAWRSPSLWLPAWVRSLIIIHMAFSISFPTRHTDTFAATGFVHAGVLLSLTELAYAAFEEHCGVSKPENVVAVQRETRAIYHAPLPWRDGAIINVVTISAGERGFEQEFTVHSAASDAAIATIVHRWVWLDTSDGRTVPLSENVQQRFLAG